MKSGGKRVINETKFNFQLSKHLNHSKEKGEDKFTRLPLKDITNFFLSDKNEISNNYSSNKICRKLSDIFNSDGLLPKMNRGVEKSGLKLIR